MKKNFDWLKKLNGTPKFLSPPSIYINFVSQKARGRGVKIVLILRTYLGFPYIGAKINQLEESLRFWFISLKS